MILVFERNIVHFEKKRKDEKREVAERLSAGQTTFRCRPERAGKIESVGRVDAGALLEENRGQSWGDR